MGLSVEAYARQLRQLLPTGAAWPVDPAAVVSRLLVGLAEELARVDARAAALVEEVDPRTTNELLADWERVLGLPDPCVTAPQTLAQRRAGAVARYITIGGQSPAYFISVAAALGYTVAITEYAPHSVESDAESAILGDAWAFVWQVDAPLNTIGEFSTEETVEDPLAWWGNDPLECVIRRLRPAHTHLIFAYA